MTETITATDAQHDDDELPHPREEPVLKSAGRTLTPVGARGFDSRAGLEVRQ